MSSAEPIIARSRFLRLPERRRTVEIDRGAEGITLHHPRSEDCESFYTGERDDSKGGKRRAQASVNLCGHQWVTLRPKAPIHHVASAAPK
ncbi:MAG: hypothetical protein Q9214_000163 [Letrouitia sp. 1 TL-2023]